MADRENRKIVLYYQSSHRLELYKKLSKTRKLEISPITIKENCSIENPHFIIKTPDNLNEYNYLYSYDFQYYYFIDDVIVLPQGQVELVCAVDPLYSLRKGIGNLIVHEERATEGQTNLVVDDEVSVMHNTIIDEVLDLDMEADDDFTGGNAWIVNVFTSCNATYNGTSGDEQNLEIPEQVKLRQEQIYDNIKSSYLMYMASQAIGQKAKWYRSMYQAFLKDITKNTEIVADNDILTNCFFYQQIGGEDSNFTSYFTRDRSVKTTYTDRCDTMFANELTIKPSWSQDDLPVRGLQLIDGTNANYRQGIPQAVKDAHAVWSAFDCSQFAWRCCLFNGVEPISINADIDPIFGATASGSATASIATYLSNHANVEYDWLDCNDNPTHVTMPINITLLINSVSDLLVGDIIISGNITYDDAGSDPKGYWLCQDEDYHWFTIKRDGIPSSIKQMNYCTSDLYDWIKNQRTGHTGKDLKYVGLINHAFVVVETGTSKIESVGVDNYTGWDKKANTWQIEHKNGSINNAIALNTIPALTMEYKGPCDELKTMFSLKAKDSSSTYLYQVFRPALLLNDGRTVDNNNPIQYLEWRDHKQPV